MKNTAMSTAPKRIVRCPCCGGPSVYAPENLHRPFCSERCKNMDSGAWASEGYRVPAPPSSEDADTEEPPKPH